MAPPKTEKGKRRKQELIDATVLVLNRVGYRDLTVADITEAANAPVGLFYRYFRNKTDIVLEALKLVVSDYKGVMSAEGSSLYNYQIAAHRTLIQLFTQSPGLLGCYYSFDYGDRAFSDFFHDQTLEFNQMHAQRALMTAMHASTADTETMLPLAHALTAMTDNFVFRYCTGRDETAALERAARVDIATLLAQVRVRAFSLSDQEIGLSRLPPVGAPPAAGRRPRAVSVAARPSPNKRLPKRVDSAASYASVTAAALRLMNRLSYDEMRIRDIEEEGGITRGGIYHYFGEKRELVMLLLRERLAAIQARLESTAVRPRASAFCDISAVIGVFLDEYRTNPGILRLLYRIEQDDAEATDLLAIYRRAWARTIGDLLGFHLGSEPHWRNTLILLGYCVLAMIERISYDLHVLPFVELSKRLSPEDQANFLAAIWMRALFLSDPEEVRRLGIMPRHQTEN